MTLISRYTRLREQRAYQRRVAAHGLPALLEPYSRPKLFLIPHLEFRLAA